MPQVPTYGAPKVARDPLSAGKLNPANSNAGQVIGGALDDLGGALQAVGEQAHRIDEAHKTAHDVDVSPETRAAAARAQLQAEHDAATLSDAQVDYDATTVAQLGQRDTGYLHQSGRAAIEAEPRVRQAIADKRQEVLDALPTRALQRQAKAQFDAQDADTARLMDAHMGVAQGTYFNETTAARIVSRKQQAAALYAIDPARLDAAMRDNAFDQALLDRRTGVSSDQHVANQLQNTSDTWSSVIQDRMDAGDFPTASKILTERAGEMTAADRARLAGPVAEGATLARARAFIGGAVKAGLAGWRGMTWTGDEAAAPIGVDAVVHGIRRIAGDLGASARTTERLVGQALSGQLDATGAAVPETVTGAPTAEDASAQREARTAPIRQAVAQDQASEAAATQVLGRTPRDWEVGLVTRAGPAAGSALLAAAAGAQAKADAAGVLSAAGVAPAEAASLLAAVGAKPGATVSEALSAARDSYADGLHAAVDGHAARPQAQYTPDAIPDRASLTAVAQHGADHDPDALPVYLGVANTLVNTREKAEYDKQEAALNDVADLLLNGVPYSQWPPAKKAALTDRSRKAFMAAEARSAPPTDDDLQFAIVRQAYADGNGDFEAFTPDAMIGVLSPARFRQYMQWRADVQQNGADGPTQGQIDTRRMIAAAQAARAAGGGQRSRNGDDLPGPAARPQRPSPYVQFTPGQPAPVAALDQPTGAREQLSAARPDPDTSQMLAPADASDGAGRQPILIKDADHQDDNIRPILAANGVLKTVKRAYETYDRFNEKYKEPYDTVNDIVDLAEATAKFIGGDIKNTLLVKPKEIISFNGRWNAPVHDDDGKIKGFVYVDDYGWEYKDARQDVSRPGRSFRNLPNWDTLPGIKFRENGAAIDRSSAGEWGGALAKFGTAAVTFGLAPLVTKFVLGMDNETYVKANEIASEMRMMQLLRRGLKA